MNHGGELRVLLDGRVAVDSVRTAGKLRLRPGLFDLRIDAAGDWTIEIY